MGFVPDSLRGFCGKHASLFRRCKSQLSSASPNNPTTHLLRPLPILSCPVESRSPPPKPVAFAQVTRIASSIPLLRALAVMLFFSFSSSRVKRCIALDWRIHRLTNNRTSRLFTSFLQSQYSASDIQWANTPLNTTGMHEPPPGSRQRSLQTRLTSQVIQQQCNVHIQNVGHHETRH